MAWSLRTLEYASQDEWMPWKTNKFENKLSCKGPTRPSLCKSTFHNLEETTPRALDSYHKVLDCRRMYLPTLTRTTPYIEEQTQHEGVNRKIVSNYWGFVFGTNFDLEYHGIWRTRLRMCRTEGLKGRGKGRGWCYIIVDQIDDEFESCGLVNGFAVIRVPRSMAMKLNRQTSHLQSLGKGPERISRRRQRVAHLL